MFAVVSIPHRVTRTLKTNKCEPCARIAANRFLEDICNIQLHNDAETIAKRVRVMTADIELRSLVSARNDRHAGSHLI